MLQHGVSGLPVIDDEGTLCGILTEGDLIRRAELGNLHAHHKSNSDSRSEHAQILAKGHAWCVHDAMTSPVHTVGPSTALGAAASLMDKRRVRRLPVVDAGKVVGVLSRHDVLKALASFNPPRDRPADTSIRLQVQTRLGDNPALRNSDLKVEVMDGIIRVKGMIATDVMELLRIEAESVSGVRSVLFETAPDNQPPE